MLGLTHGMLPNMSGARIHAVQTTVRTISDFAMGLSETPEGPNKIMSLTPTAIFANMLRMIRSRHPRFGKLITATAPFIVLWCAWMKLYKGGGMLAWIVQSVRSRAMATVSVPSGHPMLDVVKKWMIAQGTHANARAMTLKQRDLHYHFRDPRSKEEDENKEKGESRNYKRNKGISLECHPNEGDYTIRFNGRTFFFQVHRHTFEHATDGGRVVKATTPFGAVPQVTISCFSPFEGTRPIQELLKHVEQEHAASQKSRTKIWRVDFDDKGASQWGGLWRPSRPLDSVTLADDKKLPLLRDMES